MALTTQDTRLFGLDLRVLWRDFLSPWKEMRHWPVLAWLTPAVHVRLWKVDGSTTVWLSDSEQSPKVAAKAPTIRFEAIELPEDMVLRRRMTLPALPGNALAEAVALEVSSISPFGSDDLVWGYSANQGRSGSSVQIEAALASRKHVAEYVAAQTSRLTKGAQPEVWIVSSSRKPMVMAGYGEARRAHHISLWLRARYALLLIALCLATVVMLTPTTRLRMRALEAVHAYNALQTRATPMLKQRENVVKSVERVAALQALLADRVDPLRSMDFLTQALPDDTSLMSVQVQGTKISLSGQTTNTAALMQQLGTQKGVRDVRAPTPATKPLGTLKESFSIEFILDPKALGTSTPSASLTTTATVTTTTATATATATATVAATKATEALPAASKPAMAASKAKP